MAGKKEARPELVDLKVTVENHSHAGKVVKKGATIKVTAGQKEWLEKEWTEKQ